MSRTGDNQALRMYLSHADYEQGTCQNIVYREALLSRKDSIGPTDDEMDVAPSQSSVPVPWHGYIFENESMSHHIFDGTVTTEDLAMNSLFTTIMDSEDPMDKIEHMLNDRPAIGAIAQRDEVEEWMNLSECS
jgi:hypothetical protein